MAFEPKRRDARTSRFFAIELTKTLQEWAGEHAPREACGLLFARKCSGGGDGAATANDTIRAVLIPNVAWQAEAEWKFELDAGAWVEAESEARGRGEVLVGIWHSHPDGPPRPSAADTRGAQMLPSGCAYLVVDLSSVGSAAAVTVWQWC